MDRWAVTSAPSLDQLRIFTAVIDCGSFSAAARSLDRSQPAVSYAIASIESQLGLTLFERGKRKPVLTESGLAILAYARRLGQLSDELSANAESLTAGLEGSLTIAADTFFPDRPLGLALAELSERFPSVQVDIRVRSREQVLQHVLDREAALGLSAIDVAWPPGIEARDFAAVEIVGVVAPSHTLARHAGRIPTVVLRDTLQITNRSAGIDGEARDVSINSSRIWRVSGLSLQVELLRRALGWGYLPMHIARREIEAGNVVQLNPATRQRGVQPWSLIFRAAQPPGPAGRLFADRLEYHTINQEN
jgi:DNA-binding transcriptional LysR family regulator